MKASIFQNCGPEEALEMDCPVCAGPSNATAWQQFERIYLVGLIPIGGPRQTTWVACPGCRQKFYSRRALPDLRILPAAQVGDWLVVRESLVHQLLAVASIGLCWAPIVNLVVAIIAWLLNRKSRTWTRVASIIGLGLNLLFYGAFGVLFLLAHLNGAV